MLQKNMCKRFLKISLFLVTMICCVFGVSVVASASGFTIRNSPPSTSNVYYYDSRYNANAGNSNYKMPNCTTYVLGRVYEITGSRFNISGNAKEYWGNNKSYACSSNAYEPALGAVVCYTSSQLGHVQIVEEIGEDSSGKYIYVSESNYGGRETPSKSFNYLKIYLSDLANSVSTGVVKIKWLEDNDGYPSSQELNWSGVSVKFQGYIYPDKAGSGVGGTTNTSFDLINNAIYRIKNVNSGKYIDIVGQSLQNEASLHQWERVDTNSQLWKAVQHSDGYSFVSVHSSKAMDIYLASASEGADLHQYTYDANPAQRFKVVNRGNGNYSLHPLCSNLALDVYGSSISNGGKIEQYAYHGGGNQLWNFELQDSEKPAISNVNITNLTSNGYTVTCTITDNVGIANVCFPTWTVLNSQDDLANDWYNTTKATGISGNTYSFNVKISDHFNESGTYITHVYAYDFNGNYVKSEVTVEVPVKQTLVNGIVLNNTYLSLTPGEIATLQATVSPYNATNKTVTWKSSNNAVAIVSGNGIITAVGAGNANITVTAADGSGVSASCTVTIAQPVMKDPIKSFVTRMYQQCLSREPDQTGLDGWVSQLKGGHMNGADIAQQFVFSNEMLSKNLSDDEFVNVLYRAMMGREADAVGKSGWVTQLRNGNMTRSQVTKAFVESTEFTKICNSYGIIRGTYDASMAPIEQFVSRFYTLCLQRSADQIGLYGWVNNLKNKYMNGAQIANSFFFSKEFVNRNVSDEKYVELLYNTLLGRASDENGKKGWVTQLKNGYMTRYDMMSSFIESNEFTDICNNYGISRGAL